MKSRKPTRQAPVVHLIMQRLGENDPTGFIKGGNFPGKWEFVTIPALIDDENTHRAAGKASQTGSIFSQRGQQGQVLLLALQGAAGRHAGPGSRQGGGRRR